MFTLPTVTGVVTIDWRRWIKKENFSASRNCTVRKPNQRLMYVVNQNQREVDVLDRETGKLLWTLGHGRGLFFDGQIFDAIRAAVDSKGNVYVAEDEGRRLTRFKVVAE